MHGCKQDELTPRSHVSSATSHEQHSWLELSHDAAGSAPDQEPAQQSQQPQHSRTHKKPRASHSAGFVGLSPAEWHAGTRRQSSSSSTALKPLLSALRWHSAPEAEFGPGPGSGSRSGSGAGAGAAARAGLGAEVSAGPRFGIRAKHMAEPGSDIFLTTGQGRNSGAHRAYRSGQPGCHYDASAAGTLRDKSWWSLSWGSNWGGLAGNRGEQESNPECSDWGTEATGRQSGSRGSLKNLRLIFVALLLLWQWSVVSGDDSTLETARQRVSDTFLVRKQLSGESTYPDRYRMYNKYGHGCCGGDECIECKQGEHEGNLNAVRLALESEIKLLKDLGCPCRIDSLLPKQGIYTGGTLVRVTVSGLDLTKVFEMGSLYCWIMKDVETYDVVQAFQVPGTSNQVSCETTAQGDGVVASEITLHGDSFAITAGATTFTYFNPAGLAISGVTPLGAPSHGTTLITIRGVNFNQALDMWCYFEGVTFKAREIDEASDTAICDTPVLPAAVSTLRLSLNELEPLDSQVTFTVYDQPRILAISPKEGFGGELLHIQAAGLGFRFDPDDGELLCRFLIADGNQTIPATRIANTSTVTCVVPKNRRGDHQITGSIPVEISLIGNASVAFTRHTTAINRFIYKCRDVDVPFTGLMNFFPQCTRGMCCPAGHLSNGTHCNACPGGTWSFPGDSECHKCPENSHSPAISPNVQSCICNDGYVGSSDGVIATTDDVCLLCGVNTVAFISPERRVETRYSQTIHTLGEYGVFGECQACPEFSTSPANSIQSTDCSCGVGYMCKSGGVPCYLRLYRRFVALAQRTCIEPTVVKISSSLQALNNCTNGTNTTGSNTSIASEVGAVACSTNCSTGQQCDSATGTCVCATGYSGTVETACDDVDECALGTDTCHEFATCENTQGSFVCTCIRGYVGDGSVDCWDGSFVCSGAVEITTVTSSGSTCWGKHTNASTASSNYLYCDQNAGTTDSLHLRVFWLELQQWSEEILLSASEFSLSSGTTSKKVFSDLAWTGTPAMVQYRISGADAWHPQSIAVRVYNGLNLFSSSGVHQWVDADGCSPDGCYEQDGARILTTAVKDFDECALGFHTCDTNANCTNQNGYYSCACNAGYFGVGTSELFGPGTICEPCAAGTYSEGGATVCTTCPDSLFTTSSMASSSIDQCLCKPGYFGAIVDGNSTCSDCPADHYCPLGEDIFPCPVGSNSPPRTGSVLDCLCNGGWSGPAGGPCSLCRPGTACTGGWIPPANCPDGNYSTAGSTACLSCSANAGFTTQGGDPWCSCEGGYFYPNFYQVVSSGTCYSAGCSPITSAATCGQASALAAAAAAYMGMQNESDWNGTFGCLYSSALQTSGFVPGGAAEFQNCSQAPGGCICQGCAPPQCIQCLAGQYSAQGAQICIDCPFTTDSEPGSTSFDNCTCAQGFYGDIAAGDNCTKCPIASDSNRGSKALSECECLEGYAGVADQTLNCSGNTITGAACFPFDYLGTSYTGCTTSPLSNNTNATQAISPWCVTQQNFVIAGADLASEAGMNAGREVWWDYCECTTCSICAKGKYTPSSGIAHCIACSEGMYANVLGATTCQSCQAFSSAPAGSDDSSDCVCNAGFNLTSLPTFDTVGTCSDINECIFNNPCDSNATCNNTEGSYTCTCNDGYYSDDYETISNCTICTTGYACSGGGREPCGANTFAKQGSVSCTDCPVNSTSPPVSGSRFACICNLGYEESNVSGVDDFFCKDINECLRVRNSVGGHNCDPAAICTNTQGSFTCECANGLAGDGVLCEANCGDGQVGGNETCDDANNVDGDGCTECQIDRGWTCSGDPSVCTDLDECAAGVDTCTFNATCVDTNGSYTCVCDPDFFGSGEVCFPCPPNANGPGNVSSSDTCGCNSGYVENFGLSQIVNSTAGPGQVEIPFQCEDVDECVVNPAVCHQFASCSNTIGSFTCQCNSGFDDLSGQGTNCLDINECAVNGTNNCDPNARCSTTNGSFVCECFPGYSDTSRGKGLAFGTNGTCQLCGTGTYAPGLNNTACTACPPNSISDPGSIHLSNCSCDLGYFGENTTLCTACPAGNYSDTRGATSCKPCEAGATTAQNASDSLLDCVCSSGFFGVRSGNTLVCSACSEGGVTPLNASSVEQCFCGRGYWEDPTAQISGQAGVECRACANCSIGYARENCEGLNQGACVDINECLQNPCDSNADCANSDGSFKCSCHANLYGNGISCSMCPENSFSDAGSTIISNCSCGAGFDTGDGSTQQIFTTLDTCSTSVEVRIEVAQLISGRRECWSNNTPGSREYCDENAGTEDDVWIRLQWSDFTYTNWYALYSSALHDFTNPQDPGAGFNFSAGNEIVASLTSLDSIGGFPYQVEYYVDGDDSFRPAKISVRFKSGLPSAGIGSQFFSTRGELCWVDINPQGAEQSLLGCDVVSGVATATLIDTSNLNSTNTTSVKGFAILSAATNGEGPQGEELRYFHSASQLLHSGR